MEDYNKQIQDLLLLAGQKGASDLHLSPAHYPMLRIHGMLVPLEEKGIVTDELTNGIAQAILKPEHKERFDANKDVDFNYKLNDDFRFRAHVYRSRGAVAFVFHVIPQDIHTLEELNLPPNLKIFTNLSQGFVLAVGATGQGKSTTLAALINIINKERTEKIVTIEDPIEYAFVPDRSMIDQREVPADTPSFSKAIRASFRENINVLMIGEMRDRETIHAAVTAAETGHLVFSTLHTNSAAQTIDRIINTFPADEQPQLVSQLADSLSGIISQRLIPSVKGGLVPAVEILVANSAARNIIRTRKPEQLNTVIDTGASEGMVSRNQSLAKLVREGQISEENGYFYSPNPKELKNLLR